MVRCTLDEDDKLKCIDTKSNSVLLQDEVVQSVCEYAIDKMVISILLTDLLIVHSWEPVRLIKKDEPGNIQKYFIAPLPDFDEYKFPFLLCSGYEHFSLINIAEFRMQTLIDASCSTMRSQQAFFFHVEKYGFSIHFSTNEMTEENMELHKWHSLQLKKDFIESLREYGRLPIAKLSKKWKLVKDLESYRRIQMQLFPDQSKAKPSLMSKPSFMSN